MPDWLARPGAVLFTENFSACVGFYRDVIGLEPVADYGDVVLLQFGGAYLMIETGGRAISGGKSRSEGAVTLRFNVTDVDAVAELLRGRGVDIEVGRYDWGTVGRFIDPDGNRCELRNETAEFERPATA